MERMGLKLTANMAEEYDMLAVLFVTNLHYSVNNI